MRIGIIGSMQFTEKMLEVRDKLIALGHDAFVTDLSAPFIGKTDEEKEIIKIHQKNNLDAIREFWNKMQGADAVLVLNYDKNGINNYIGGNTLMEIGFAHVLNQKIFLLNPIPEIFYYKTEIEAVKPTIINGDLTLIKDVEIVSSEKAKPAVNENKTVPLGKYQHYKGKFYEVIGEGRHSEDLSEYVVYRGLYDSFEFGKNSIWVRPKKMFFKNVVVGGKEVPRFRLVDGKKGQ